jgi:hypothetical protein
VVKGSSELFGGPRIVTFMIYLTDVELGGHTVFPQAGISVRPTAGDALYWFNHDAVEENDSRFVFQFWLCEAQPQNVLVNPLPPP